MTPSLEASNFTTDDESSEKLGDNGFWKENTRMSRVRCRRNTATAFGYQFVRTAVAFTPAHPLFSGYNPVLRAILWIRRVSGVGRLMRVSQCVAFSGETTDEQFIYIMIRMCKTYIRKAGSRCFPLSFSW